MRSAAGDLLHADDGRPELGRRDRLDTAAFGVEFGPASGGPVDAGPTRFSAQISAYCLDLATRWTAHRADRTHPNGAAEPRARLHLRPGHARRGARNRRPLSRADRKRRSAGGSPGQALGKRTDGQPPNVYVSL